MQIVILTNGNYFSQLISRQLFVEKHTSIAGVVIITDSASNSRLSLLWELWRRTGWRHLSYKMSTYLVFGIVSFLQPRRIHLVRQLAVHYRIPVLHACDVNGASTAVQIRAWDPDLLVSVSCPQLIKEDLLAIPTEGSINVHCSLLPEYGGISPNVWVLANGENKTGVTIHSITERLDTGNIILQEETPIVPEDSAFSLFKRQCEQARSLLHHAVELIEEGNAPSQTQDLANRSYFSWPTKAAIAQLHQRGRRLAAVHDFWDAIREV